MKHEPLVSVVTPVYNGKDTIRQAIESVLAQTHPNWHYVVIDNCSDDGTSEIIAEYADDARISVVRHQSLIPAIDNLNFAMTQVADDSVYCQVVHADDFLKPRCLASKVALGEKYPNAAIIGSYALQRGEVVHKGLPPDEEVFPGAHIARETLALRVLPWRTPSTLLLRSDVVRGRKPFYKAPHHGDQTACFEILRDHEFAFVHEVLVEIGDRGERLTARALKPINRFIAFRLDMLVRYGPAVWQRDEYAAELERLLDSYYRFLARSFLACRDAAFWRIHREAMASSGQPMSALRLLGAVVDRFRSSPWASFKELARGIAGRAGLRKSAA